MGSLEITGGEQFAVLAAKLRAAAAGDLQRELTAATVKASKPLVRAGRSSALENLPHTGGLNRRVASSRFTTSRRLSGVQIRVKGMDQLALTNRGQVKHPVYGRKVWVTQSIPQAKDWFFKPMRDGADAVRRELIKAMHRVAEKIT